MRPAGSCQAPAVAAHAAALSVVSWVNAAACRISDFFEDIWASYAEQDSQEQGVSTGWRGLDPYYRVRIPVEPWWRQCSAAKGRSAAPDAVQVVPGELSIVTGVPNSGKSEWIDALLCNLAEQSGWSFAMCSMEKKACALLWDSSAYTALTPIVVYEFQMGHAASSLFITLSRIPICRR